MHRFDTKRGEEDDESDAVTVLAHGGQRITALTELLGESEGEEEVDDEEELPTTLMPHGSQLRAILVDKEAPGKTTPQAEPAVKKQPETPDEARARIARQTRRGPLLGPMFSRDSLKGCAAAYLVASISAYPFAAAITWMTQVEPPSERAAKLTIPKDFTQSHRTSQTAKHIVEAHLREIGSRETAIKACQPYAEPTKPMNVGHWVTCAKAITGVQSQQDALSVSK